MNHVLPHLNWNVAICQHRFCPWILANTNLRRQMSLWIVMTTNILRWDKMAAILQSTFLNENAWILLKISLKFVPEVRINNIPALVQIMAWRQPGDKLLSESMMVSLLLHIWLTQPQWYNWSWHMPYGEWVMKFNYSRHLEVHVILELCNHNLYIGIITFPDIDYNQSTGHN